MNRPLTLQLHVKKMQLTPQIESHLLKRFSFCQDHPLHLTIEPAQSPTGGHEVHARCEAFRKTLIAKADGKDPYSAIDGAADILKRQISQLHARVVEHKPKHS